MYKLRRYFLSTHSVPFFSGHPVYFYNFFQYFDNVTR